MREALDLLVGVVSELRDEPYSAVPLLVMAAVVEGGLAGTLAAMLQVGAPAMGRLYQAKGRGTGRCTRAITPLGSAVMWTCGARGSRACCCSQLDGGEGWGQGIGA